MAFCYDTSQSQLAVQLADTVQFAVAVAALSALAANIASTIQYVWHLQQACEQECYGTSQSQAVVQARSTSRTGVAIAGGAPDSNVDLPPIPVAGTGGLPDLPAWLTALALNVGATIQTIFQSRKRSAWTIAPAKRWRSRRRRTR